MDLLQLPLQQLGGAAEPAAMPRCWCCCWKWLCHADPAAHRQLHQVCRPAPGRAGGSGWKVCCRRLSMSSTVAVESQGMASDLG